MHSREVLARGGDPEAHSILQRTGFVPVVRRVAALLGLGKVAQRKQDTKTAAAWALVEVGQLALAELEKLHETQAIEADAATELAPAEASAPTS